MTRPLSVSQQLQQNSHIVFTTLLVSVPLVPASELQSNYNPTYLVENPGIDLRTSRKPWSANPNIVEIQLKEEFQSTPESQYLSFLQGSCSQTTIQHIWWRIRGRAENAYLSGTEIAVTGHVGTSFPLQARLNSSFSTGKGSI